MQEWVENLLALQDRDLRIAALEEQVRSAPGEKERVARLEADAEEALASARERLQGDEKGLNSLDMLVETIRARMRDFQSKSTMIKNNDEYRAALTQIEACAKQIETLEDQELVIMEDIEAARSLVAQRRKELDATKARVQEMLTDLDTRVRNCETQLAQLTGERGDAVAAVPVKMVTRYERLRKSKAGRQPDRPVFVAIRQNVCDSCHMKVTAQTRMNARKGEGVSCENCSAMLYWED